MTKKFVIAGNWKMFKTVAESADFISSLHSLVEGSEQHLLDAVEILVFPPFTALYPVKDLSPIIKTGAQNLHFEDNGAFTGEISPLMLANVVDYVLIGHSERREIFGEPDAHLNKKIKTALKYGFTPILCIGESLAEREAGRTFAKVQTQLDLDLEGLSDEEAAKIVIAYEPIWAIGTGKVATPEQAQEVHAHIREIFKKKFSKKNISQNLKILYGGSVKPNNSHELLSKNDINGVLVGGASLKVADFFAIIQTSFKLAIR